MEVSLIQIVILALIQGAAELLPVSSSAHVIIAEKLMGIDPSAPEMTFLLVMLHTGTMFAVLYYFWPRWRKLKTDFFKMVLLATAITGVVGLGLKKFIEKVIFGYWMGEPKGEIEHLFKNLPLMATALFSVGLLIIFADWRESRSRKRDKGISLAPHSSILIGLVQGLCLPFRGFSRSGATISTGLLLRIPQGLAEDFSFALAVVLTPPVIVLELHRLLKALDPSLRAGFELGHQLFPGFLGMIFSFGSGLLALRWLSSWLEKGRWKFFGGYCLFAALGVVLLHLFWF